MAVGLFAAAIAALSLGVVDTTMQVQVKSALFLPIHPLWQNVERRSGQSQEETNSTSCVSMTKRYGAKAERNGHD